MKNVIAGLLIWSVFALGSGIGGLSCVAFGQSVTTGAPLMLFDGQSKQGWTKADGSAHDGWVVQDGTLHRKSGGGDLFHQGTFRDYVLYFQWKISEQGNSGVKYRVRKYDNAWLGCEYQILDDQGNHKERHKTAGLYDVYDPVSHKPIVAPRVWQFSKIVVCGNHIQHWLNGVLVVQANVGTEDWNQRVQSSKFRDRQGFGANRDGKIFLQDHGNPVWFREIVLVPLNCDGMFAQDSYPAQDQTADGPSPSGPAFDRAMAAGSYEFDAAVASCGPNCNSGYKSGCGVNGGPNFGSGSEPVFYSRQSPSPRPRPLINSRWRPGCRPALFLRRR